MVEDVAERGIDVGGSVTDSDLFINARALQVGNNLKLPILGGMLRWNGLPEQSWNEQQQTNEDCEDETILYHDITPLRDPLVHRRKRAKAALVW